MLRLSWILGLVTTGEYSKRLRTARFGPEYAKVELPDCAVNKLEATLKEHRIALIVFLVGITVVVYTLINGPIVDRL
jgi:hypothetical protein